MKIDAYIVSCCNNMVEEDQALGIIGKINIFNEQEFISVTPDKSNIHYCMKCYRKYVLDQVRNEIPKRGTKEKEIEYQNLLNTLANKFKSRIFFSKPLKKK
jgi:hypothetical protein